MLIMHNFFRSSLFRLNKENGFNSMAIEESFQGADYLQISSDKTFEGDILSY